MASFTINVVPWPVGQSVSVFPAEAWPDTTLAPSGAPLATAAVSSASTVTFDGLPDNRRLVAYALGQGVRFGTAATGLQAAVAVPDRERIAALESSVASGGVSGARVLLWNSTTSGYEPAEWTTDTSLPREFVGPVDPASIFAIVGPVYGDRWTPTAAT